MSKYLRALAALPVAGVFLLAGCGDDAPQPVPSTSARTECRQSPADGCFSPKWAAIGLGQSGPAVWQIQQWLKASGQSLRAHGVFGAETDRAVRELQRANDLDADGLVGPATWPVLRESASGGTPPARSANPADGYFASNWAPFGLGSSGPAVWQVQQWLKAAGQPVGVDGLFGPQMDAAVRAFQRRAKLDADGLVGPNTWAALRKAAL